MEYNPKLAVVYSEDVAEAFRCCPTTAIRIMKATGKAFKVGRRWAITAGTLYAMLQGSQDSEMGAM